MIQQQDTAIRAVLHGCEDPEHRKLHEALATLVRGLYKLDTIPVRIRDVVVNFLVHDTLHFTDDDTDLGDNLNQLFGSAPYFSTMALFAATIAAVPMPDKPVGQYL